MVRSALAQTGPADPHGRVGNDIGQTVTSSRLLAPRRAGGGAFDSVCRRAHHVAMVGDALARRPLPVGRQRLRSLVGSTPSGVVPQRRNDVPAMPAHPPLTRNTDRRSGSALSRLPRTAAVGIPRTANAAADRPHGEPASAGRGSDSVLSIRRNEDHVARVQICHAAGAMKLHVSLEDDDHLRLAPMEMRGDPLVGIGEDLAESPSPTGVSGRDDLAADRARSLAPNAVALAEDPHAVERSHGCAAVPGRSEVAPAHHLSRLLKAIRSR